MHMIRKKIQIRVPVAQAFVIDQKESVVDACHLYMNEIYLMIDEYPFFSYAARYKPWNGKYLPIIEVEINAHGTVVYEHVQLMPDDYVITRTDEKFTIHDADEWFKRTEPIEKWERDRLRLEFANKMNNALNDPSLAKAFLKKHNK